MLGTPTVRDLIKRNEFSELKEIMEKSKNLGMQTFDQALIDLVHEGRRWVDPDNTVRLPSWTRVDVGLKAQQRLDGSNLTWRLGVANLFDKRAWREAPTLTGHIYLFPLAERTVTGSLQVDF